jgi:hypothetical protein
MGGRPGMHPYYGGRRQSSPKASLVGLTIFGLFVGGVGALAAMQTLFGWIFVIIGVLLIALGINTYIKRPKNPPEQMPPPIVPSMPPEQQMGQMPPQQNESGPQNNNPG